MTDLWDNNKMSHDSDKSTDEDMHLDQPINEGTIINLNPDMIQMPWMSMPSLLILMRWPLKNKTISSRKDFASNARNQVSLKNAQIMDHRTIKTSIIEIFIIAPLLNEMTTEYLLHTTTINSETYTIWSRNQDHEKSTRWFKLSPSKKEKKCSILQKEMMKRKEWKKGIFPKESWVDDSLSYLEYSQYLFYHTWLNR